MDYKDYNTLYNLHIEQKKTMRQIGEIFSVNRKTIEYHLKKLGVPRLKYCRPKKEDNIPIEDVLKLIEEGWLLLDIADKYNVDRNVIKRLVSSHGYNFRNHKNQRSRQSEFMKTEANPTLGTTRPPEVWQKVHESNRKKARERWNNISTYRQYSKVARGIAYVHYGEGKYIPKGYVIDHIFSLKDCWEAGVDVEVASHPNNVRLITEQENLKKGASSNISIEEFLSMVSNSTTIETTSTGGRE